MKEKELKIYKIAMIYNQYRIYRET